MKMLISRKSKIVPTHHQNRMILLKKILCTTAWPVDWPWSSKLILRKLHWVRRQLHPRPRQRQQPQKRMLPPLSSKQWRNKLHLRPVELNQRKTYQSKEDPRCSCPWRLRSNSLRWLERRGLLVVLPSTTTLMRSSRQKTISTPSKITVARLFLDHNRLRLMKRNQAWLKLAIKSRMLTK